jgi:hypothetical protein
MFMILDATIDNLIVVCDASPELELDVTWTKVWAVLPFCDDADHTNRTLCVEDLREYETFESLFDFFQGLFKRVLHLHMCMKTARDGQNIFTRMAFVELETKEAAAAGIEQSILYRGWEIKMHLRNFRGAPKG